MSEKSYAPIVLFVYNRLEHLRQTLRSLQSNDFAKESELFVFSDGPKDDADSKDKVAEVRSFIKEIAGFEKITIVESERNKGLANSTIDGVTEIVNRYGKVIVLEDDLETSPDFLRFMNEALGVYEDEQQVMQVAGHMFNVSLHAETDAVFLPFTNSIGWATWKRAWAFFDPSMSGYKRIREDNELKRRFNLDDTYNYFQMLESQLEGNIDSWAIRWYLDVFLNNGLVVYPIESLIKHIGFDEQGTHANRADGIYARYCARLSCDKICFPPVILDRDAYSCVKKCLSPECKSEQKVKSASMVKTLLTKISNLLRV